MIRQDSMGGDGETPPQPSHPNEQQQNEPSSACRRLVQP